MIIKTLLLQLSVRREYNNTVNNLQNGLFTLANVVYRLCMITLFNKIAGALNPSPVRDSGIYTRLLI